MSGGSGYRKFYAREYASTVYAGHRSAEEHPYYRLVTSFVERHDLRGKRCLEVGCGRGVFQDVVADYVGTDLCGSVGRSLHKPFVQCDGARMPFPADTFDGIWSITVLEHVPEPERALEEMRRVLRPEGVLLLAPAWHTRPWFASGLPVRPYRDLKLREKLAKLSIPLRDAAVVRYPRILLRRVIRSLSYASSRGPMRFSYTRLSPNYDRYWMSDSDAANSLDPLDVIVWFLSRGDLCLSHPTFLARLFVRSLALVVKKAGS